MAIDTDHNLLAQFRAGDEAAFEALFGRYYERVFRVAYGLCGSRDEAEDVAQETFLTLYRSPPDAVHDTGLGAWLCRVALNRGSNMLRGERRARERAERLGDEGAIIDPQIEVVRSEERARVRAALAHLPERQARILLLRHAGLAYSEIAEVIHVAPGSIGTLLARAERALLAQLERIETNEHARAMEARNHNALL